MVDLSAAPYHLTRLAIVPSGVSQVEFNAFGLASESVSIWLEIGQSRCIVTIPSNEADFQIFF